MTKKPSVSKRLVGHRRPIRRGTRTAFRGSFYTVRRESWQFPEGRQAVRDVVIHPGSVVIVPFLDQGHVVLIRQFRTAVGRYIWEVPAGTRESGEAPRRCAARELIEETGFRAQTFQRVGRLFPSPGFSSEMMTVYAAWGLTEVPRPAADDDPLTVHVVPFAKVYRMIQDGRILDAKTIIGILQAKRHRAEFFS